MAVTASGATASRVLIVPLWNLNSKVNCWDKYVAFSFNRTFMELKFDVSNSDDMIL